MYMPRLREDFKSLKRCLGQRMKDTNISQSQHQRCLLHFQQRCLQSRLRLLKVIRLPVRSLFWLLRQNVKLKVLYLVRDPRSTLISQSKVFSHHTDVSNMCEIMLEDVRSFRLLQKEFPHRCIPVRYEDIVSRTNDTVASLYKALSLNLTDDVSLTVRKFMTASKTKESAYSIYRSDPEKSENRWRQVADISFVHLVEHHCRQVFNWLGYKYAGDVDTLRNMTMSLTEPSPPTYLMFA